MAVCVTTRFAPSPTGALHLGHAAAALFAWERAGPGGQFLLRIEDIDQTRCRAAHVEGIFADLTWLGLSWPSPVRRQSEHLPAYRAVLERLREEGLLYPCFCTRAEIAREVDAAGGAPHGPDGGPIYPGTCRLLAAADRQERLLAGAAHAWRLDMRAAVARTGRLSFREGGVEVACHAEAFGDVVLGRKEVPASYHLCVAHDDAVQGVSLVTRGEDLRPATAIHRVLQSLMGWEAPSYAHHRMLLGADGRRLAKRDGAPALQALRAQGVSAAAVRAMVAGLEPAA